MEHTTSPTTHPIPDGLLFAPRFVAPAKGLGVVWPVDGATEGGLPPHPAYWTVPSAAAMAAMLHLQGLPLAVALSPLAAALAWAGYIAGRALWTLARLRRLGPDPRASAWPWEAADAEARRILAEGFAGEEAAFLAQARRVTLVWSGQETGTSVLSVVVETETRRCIYAPLDARRVPWRPHAAWWARAPHRLQHLHLIETRLDLTGHSRHQRLAWMAELARSSADAATSGAHHDGKTAPRRETSALARAGQAWTREWETAKGALWRGRTAQPPAAPVRESEAGLPRLLLLDKAEL